MAEIRERVDGFAPYHGGKVLCTLPTESIIIDLHADGTDLIAETAAGEIFRIDAKSGVIRAN